MCETTVIREGDALRSIAETFIRNVYATEYDAQLRTFPSLLFALMNERAEILCAAGIRLQEDGFFSERYLDSPIEQALGTASKRTITRSEIFEVTTFASRAPRATMQFIKSLGVFGELNGFAWSFFTLTQRLHRLVERLGHPLTHLADADYRRIPDHERWGTYYASQPKVFAIANPRLGLDGNDVQGSGSLHAESV
jgi:Thermostable hemolysin